MAAQLAHNRKSRSKCCQTTLNSNLRGLDKLFKSLEVLKVPNFLELMAAINDISDFYTGDLPDCPDCHRF